MSFANDHRLLRNLPVACLAAALAAVAGCKGPDPSNFACTSSRECPGDYHCDLGTATSAGSLKCVSGAPVPRTLTADATKFLLVKQAGDDGTVRTTISAAPGAITSTPDFVGVRAFASTASGDLGSSSVQSDGSVQVFQLPQAVTQVSLRIQDDSGRSINVTGYPERVVMSFAGKQLAGNTNPIAAYDAPTGTDSLFDPAAWIAAGLTEIPASSPVNNGLVTPAAYNGISSFDGIVSVTAAPPQPTTTGPIGWERITIAPTASNPVTAPSPRTDMAVVQTGISVGSNFYPFIAFGGLDATGAAADPGSTPTIWAFNPNGGVGWTTVPTVTSTTSPGPFPSNFTSFGLATTTQLATISRSGAALAAAGSYNCTSGSCIGINYNMSFVVAGGTKPDGTKTSNIFAYGSRTNGGSVFLGWWDATAEGTAAGASNPRLLAANAGMASAPLVIPVPSGTNQVFFNGVVMVGGSGIIPAGQPGANNDTAACQYLTTFGGANPTFQVNSCNTPEWTTAAAVGQIGFRTGAALTPTDNTGADGQAVYLFGGSRSAGPAGANGLQNDLWKGTISVVCVPAPPATPPCAPTSTAVTQITWVPVATAGTAPTSKPTPRSGSAIAFGDFHKLVVYGGTDATGVQSDVWELDMTPSPPPAGGFAWRKFSIEPTPALAPAARTKASMQGALFYASNRATLLFGGAVGATLTNDVWALSRQGAPRLLIKAPAGISSRSQVTNAKLSIIAAGPSFPPSLLYAWDGSAWQFVGAPGNSGNIFASLPNALSYVQSDGNVYLLLMSAIRSTPTFASTFAVQLDGLQAALDFQ
jgi:hypothetical protein